MKKYFILLFLLICTTLFSQSNYDNEWKEVYQHELDGKTRSAYESVQKIYKKVKRKKDDIQIIKCFFYTSKFTLALEEEAQSKVIQNITREINDANGNSKAILNYIYASLLKDYYNQNSYKIRQRTSIENENNANFLLWNEAKFESEIIKQFESSLQNKNQLQQQTITDYNETFIISPDIDGKNYTLYDYLWNEYFDYLKRENRNWEIKRTVENNAIIEKLYSTTEHFITLSATPFNESNFKRIIELFQEKEKLYAIDNIKKANNTYAVRLSYIHTIFQNNDLYIQNLKFLEAITNNQFLKQQLRIDRAKFLASITTKNSTINHYDEVLTICDSVLQSITNNNALADAENLKNTILLKSFNLKIKHTLYENENTRAFVEYRNIDTLTIYYYRIPKGINFEKNYNKTDSTVTDYISKNKPFKQFFRILPNKKDYFETSTEILLENLPLGDYLMVIQPNNKKLDSTIYKYEMITVSNIIHLEDENEEEDLFYVLDRRTGKPLQNIIAKNDEETKRTDQLGKVGFKKKKYEKNTSYSSDAYFIHKNDTLVEKYSKGLLQDESYTTNEDEDFAAKPMLYLDRAIYRPGQKVYYKGIIAQTKNEKRSVVPFVTVLVTIEDTNNNTLKEYEVQTNDFGSFTGEFDIPKNILTGEFTITIDEPDNYENDTKYYNEEEDEHSFWDNVDFDSDEFTFQVEEYKRPTFEVDFNTIKENYTIGDTLKIVGNAKTLAGSNLTNAKVKYTISQTTMGNKFNNNNIDDVIGNTETNEKGEFTIIITANDSLIENKDINKITYYIKAEVIDSNGETRTTSISVYVGKETLVLNLYTNSKLYKEDQNTLEISAKTLNHFPIDAKGKIEIYYIEKKNFLKPRLFYFPENQNINEATFRKLFPNEPYNNEDSETKEILVKTIDFNTKNEKSIAFNFLKDYKNGNYKITAKAFDSKNNAIEKTTTIQLKSRTDIFDETKLFTFKDITTIQSDYFEFEFFSTIPNLIIFSRSYLGKKLDNEQIIELKKGIGKVRIKKDTNTKEDFYFHFSTFYDDEIQNENHEIKKETVEKKLEFEILSLRNKIEPGSKENWSFKIANQETETEVLASMYDSSLDQFTEKNWNTNLYFQTNNYGPKYPNYYRNKINTVYFNNFSKTPKYYHYYITNPKLNTFGLDFNNRNNQYSNEKYVKDIKSKLEIPKNAVSITGKIVNINGQSLSGVIIIVQGTNRSAESDFDGNFSIQVEENETLTFSYISMIDAYYTIKNKNEVLHIIMEEDNTILDNVVVVGYGMKTKKSLTGSSYKIMRIQNSSFSSEAETFAYETLNGQHGIQVVNDSAQPGSAPIIRLRGPASLKNTNEPLYIVDGVSMSTENFAKIKTEDIDNVSVLKGESATALYGSKASNGVIIITTKKALQELTQVKTRTNFNETAFFFPQLQTDKEGKISFNFTTPESLTRWKLRLLGHNKNFETGYFQSDIVSQKDIMVMPNLPRFVREKDTLTITTKVVNMTNETKSGLAMLLLFDATNGVAIDSIAMNRNNTKKFICKPKESVSVSWTITIPENLQGLQYKIVAKSGNFSDGEENILPVLSNKILITESIPLWVRENSTKEYVFENLKNNTSTTLQHHSFTLEYTSNPVWFALQSLPYLMEYEHECAEQTFSRYYANTLASEIINKNPNIAALFESYRKEESPKKKLEINKELKSILLAETPWYFDSEDETTKNKQLAYLFDSATLKNTQNKTLEKLETKQLSSGGFPWFDGGEENTFITQHILSGIGHLNKLIPNTETTYKNITSKSIPYLDSNFINRFKKNKKHFTNYSYTDVHFLYTRSFFIDQYPLSKKLDSIVQQQLKEVKEHWLSYSLYQKGQLALVFNRFGDANMAQKMITHLKETASLNEDLGMYWIENTKSWYWYQSPIETQSILIEAFNEVTKDITSVDLMKVWLLKNKQHKNWSTTKATTEAIYAILLQGKNWTTIEEKTKFKIGNEKILSQKLSKKEKEATTGYIKMHWKADEITTDMANISIQNKSDVPSYGGVYWQYFENLENIKESTNAVLNIKKELFKKENTPKGSVLKPIAKKNIIIGDIITIRLEIKAIEDLEFVHLKDLRASCFEPIDVISTHERRDNLYFYKSTKDVATHFFFDKINKGTYVLEYDVRVNNSGNFNDGIATLQSMYAPEFSANSKNNVIKVSK
ncbi:MULTISPECIES: MG2 domain-containing protein [Flavobacterium]|uniref:MG2 domain-containing protein n=1 Tax=Flavobacterium jumunjinense TaxID=998845 RepID=A0ABV5GP99_9FLAO|nr:MULTISPECIES: MG2 domain-containing protein [Flavobacterium]